MRFASSEDLNKHLLEQPSTIAAAIILEDDLSIRAPAFQVNYNFTRDCAYGVFFCNEPWRDVLLPVQARRRRRRRPRPWHTVAPTRTLTPRTA